MKEMLLNELKIAMREKDEIKKNTITLLRAAILQIEKDEQKVLTDDEMQIIATKEVKKRRESIIEFEKVERYDLVEDLNKEIEILNKYIPKQLTQEDVLKLVKESIINTGASTPRDMGKVMQDLKQKTLGKADGKLVSNIVKELLG
ncbi:MAG: GatB/YqeY domain-containing protein [Clostridia bacterium]